MNVSFPTQDPWVLSARLQNSSQPHKDAAQTSGGNEGGGRQWQTPCTPASHLSLTRGGHYSGRCILRALPALGSNLKVAGRRFSRGQGVLFPQLVFTYQWSGVFSPTQTTLGNLLFTREEYIQVIFLMKRFLYHVISNKSTLFFVG